MKVQASTQDVIQHVLERLGVAVTAEEPYRHFYTDQAFPDWYYEMMLAELPSDDFYTDRTYENRMMISAEACGTFWRELESWMGTSDICALLLKKFDLVGRFGANVRLVRDKSPYKIKVHTDVKSKAVSLLFYLAKNADVPEMGTSVFVPKEQGFSSDGTRRYEFEDFTKVYTAPFLPNTVFGFPRSDVSFHGVEPIDVAQRDVLLLNIYRAK